MLMENFEIKKLFLLFFQIKDVVFVEPARILFCSMISLIFLGFGTGVYSTDTNLTSTEIMPTDVFCKVLFNILYK